MKKMVTAGVAGLMMVAAGMPATAQAGHREWETAGKILTGAVIGGIIHSACTAPSPARPVFYEHREYRHFQRPDGPPHCVRPPVPPCPPPRHDVMPSCRGPIILNMEDGRRLYQPPEQGHVAYIQVWSSVSKQWISIAEYPSIW